VEYYPWTQNCGHAGIKADARLVWSRICWAGLSRVAVAVRGCCLAARAAGSVVTQPATTISGPHSTRKFTELAMKHFSCAGLWSVRARSVSLPAARVTVGGNTTLLNRPAPRR